MKILLKTGEVLHVKDAKTFDEIQDGNRAYNLQDPRKPKAECRTCKQPFVGTPMQKDCDACIRRRKAR